MSEEITAEHLQYLDSLDKRASHERWRPPDVQRERRPDRRRRAASAATPRRSKENATRAAASVQE